MPRVRFALPVVALALLPATASAAPRVIADGPARFTVIAPGLIRAEYAADGAFEDRPTMTARRGVGRPGRVTTRVRAGWREVRTGTTTLRWRRGSGPFTAETLRLRSRGVPDTGATPGGARRQLGGWTRALDLLTGPVPLNPGVLTRDGWTVVDDSRTILLTATAPGFATRPVREGAYQDLYVFAYGRDLAGALRDLRTLTGAAPLLDRASFGVWFSQYFPYSDAQLRAVAADLERQGLPLGMLSLDTDYKRQADPAGAAIAAAVAGAPGLPYSWNGWDWNRELFPDPKAFMDWAHSQGITVAANIHPSINSNDPAFAGLEQRTGPLGSDDGMCRVLQADPTGVCKVFDWTKAAQLEAYFALHRPFTDAGVDALWLDWCCEAPEPARAPGLTADTWINSRYAADQRARGQRWPAFSRIGASFLPDGVYGDRQRPDGGVGALAEHRSTVQFTGDTCATWEMLAFEAQMTTAAAAIGMPYVSHDIGSFGGAPVAGQCNGTLAGQTNRVEPEMYARWVQFATFEPLDRLHSHHGDRLPGEYPGAPGEAAAAALRLRTALVPLTYTLARRAHDTGLPVTGPLWLAWPGQEGAYEHPTQRTFGPDLVVAPVTGPGDPASVEQWIPPGTWEDRDTGARLRGPATRRIDVPLRRIPVLVRAGALLVTAPGARPATPAPDLTVDAYAGPRGRFTLYEDAGRGLAHERGAAARTTLTQRRARGTTTITIGAARGRYAGMPATRSWTLRLHGIAGTPRVTVGGRRVAARRDDDVLVVATGARPLRRALRIVVSGG